MKPHDDVDTTNNYHRSGCSCHDGNTFSSIFTFSIRKTDPKVYPVSGKGSAFCGIRTADCLLLKKCKYFFRQPRNSRSNRHCGSGSSASLETSDAVIDCRRNHLLYASRSISILSSRIPLSFLTEIGFSKACRWLVLAFLSETCNDQHDDRYHIWKHLEDLLGTSRQSRNVKVENIKCSK